MRTEKQGQKATCEPSKESSICKLLSTLNFSFPPSPFTLCSSTETFRSLSLPRTQQCQQQPQPPWPQPNTNFFWPDRLTCCSAYRVSTLKLYKSMKSVRSVKESCDQKSVRSKERAIKEACDQKSVRSKKHTYDKKRAFKEVCRHRSVRSKKHSNKAACAQESVRSK